MTFRILISDKMTPQGLSCFTGHTGFEIVYNPEITMEALAECLGEYDALVIRSRTQVTRAMLAKPGKLQIIGRAGAGVDNVDVDAATEKGIIVMNTPGGNTLSTAEHAISMLLSLARRIPQADQSMHAGKWDKKTIMGTEIFGKVLGVVGLGRIGRVVAEHMQAFGMEVIVHDPLLTQETADKLGVRPVSIEEMCRQADAITIHAPLNDDTRGIIGAPQLALMKPTALLVNCARGGIIDEKALCEALRERKIGGAALDVFEIEPLPADHPLRGLDNVVLTPHLAASTTEAQEKVARDIAVQVRETLSGEMVRNAVNAPSVDAKTFARIHHVLDLCGRLGKFCGQFSPVASRHRDHLQRHVGPAPERAADRRRRQGLPRVPRQQGRQCRQRHVPGPPARHPHQRNAPLQQQRHLCRPGHGAHRQRLRRGPRSQRHADPRNMPKIVIIDGRRLDIVPEGYLLVIGNRDLPGFVGSIGTLLGNENINIATMNVARNNAGDAAVTVISVDGPVPPHVLKEIQNLHNVLNARAIVI